MVTVCPADVVTVKLEVDTLPTVPTVPPAAGPDRAFDVPPVARPGRGPAPVVVFVVPATAALLPEVALRMP
jgi:hypothetical protein